MSNRYAYEDLVFVSQVKIMKDTLLVNLYAGPGSGKSTGAAYILLKIYILKKNQIE